MKIAVVIPIYRTEFQWFERIALEQAKRVLGRYPICFLVPEGLDVDRLLPENGFTESFPPECFKGIDGYNALLLSENFYRRFSRFDYILIHQLDAFAFSDQLERFCRMGYDYIGAPWSFCGHKLIGTKTVDQKTDILHVGNGGFSLRNPRACLSLLERYAQQLETWPLNEDTFFAYFGKKRENEFRLATIRVASLFSCEIDAARWYRKNGNALPFGCHGWHKYSADFYLDAFAQVGYDLRPYRGQMAALDMEDQARRLHVMMTVRLCQRVLSGRPVLPYLPENGKPYVAHLIDQPSMELFQQLRKDGIAVSPQIFGYEEGDVASVVGNVKKTADPSATALILSVYDDSETVSRLEGEGLQYGKDFVSFWQEYIGRGVRWLRGLYAATAGRKI